MDFSVELVKEVLVDEFHGDKNNVASSPLSIAALLNILAMGSSGTTLQKLLSVFDIQSLDEFKSYYSNLAAIAADNSSAFFSGDNDCCKGPNINFANGVWVNQLYILNPSYRHYLNSIFGVHVKSLDFQHKRAETAKEINSWASDSTNGLINCIINAKSINSTMKIFLANALYFKGSWETAFDSSLTKDSEFHLLNGKKIKLPFMRYENFEYNFYASFKTFKVTKLPYQNHPNDTRRFSMHLFLPHEKDGLNDLLTEFSANPVLFLNEYLAMNQEKLYKFMVPKFKFLYKFEVSPLLGRLGLALEDLTEMIENEIHVPKISQVAFIEVNEEGTEAAAITEDDDMGCCLDYKPPPPPPSFIADHPFMFMIKEDTSATPFFIGLVFNPLEE